MPVYRMKRYSFRKAHTLTTATFPPPPGLGSSEATIDTDMAFPSQEVIDRQVADLLLLPSDQDLYEKYCSSADETEWMEQICLAYMEKYIEDEAMLTEDYLNRVMASVIEQSGPS